MITDYDWAVVGAGPAGIAAIGQLLDQGVTAERLVWIDPDFTAGDFCCKWHAVSSNTRVQLFMDYLYASKAFDFVRAPRDDFSLFQFGPHDTCRLTHMRAPLLWVTENLRRKCSTFADRVERIAFDAGHGSLLLASGRQFTSSNVVLAVGAEPKRLDLGGPHAVMLEDVLDESRVSTSFAPDDTVAVFGSSHSAVIAIRHLLERPVKTVVNFYRQPLRYAVHFDDWILFDDTGLKGETAAWAKTHLNDRCYPNLVRAYSDGANIERLMGQCNKVVYATGFERRSIEIAGLPSLEYDPCTGIIAPGLFGAGIAFPERFQDRLGHRETRVGLWKFMTYLQRVVPIWLRYGAHT